MAAMNEVSDLLPDTVLLDYIRAQIPSNDKLWTFRKHLAVQYACQVTMCFCVHVCLPVSVSMWVCLCLCVGTFIYLTVYCSAYRCYICVLSLLCLYPSMP